MAIPDNKRRLSDWFRQWRSPLRKFLLGKAVVPAADVDDVAQEVFLRLMRYRKGELVEHPQAYLFKIASNVAAEWSIRARNRQPHEPQWLAGLAASEQPEALLLQDAAQTEIERAIARLTPRQREILKLTFTENLAQHEIAARVQDTPRSVRRQLAKSYEQLRYQLDPDLLRMIDHGHD